ncbi:putative protein kinase RLK-Pelle-WAK-LRK10L-1 family [Helianthus annuus]|nr:putative protein kinase RLK-Pelle-WAK-LRK10L-1 family [Helianthus annuus]KAJ0633222.1 putative protein kinase RLK-Pelle-WAK-LRK10L-1 family [Helianthus annuus]
MTSLSYPHPHSLLLLLLPVFLIAQTSQSNNISNHSCPSYKCGDVPISYPFWINDSESTTQFCGYEGFGINCSTIGDRSIPEITLNGDSFYVLRIIPEYKSVILADRDVSFLPPVPNSCPRLQHGINLETLPLYFTTSNTNLSFNFDCTGCPSLATEIRIPCFESNQRKSCVHILSTTTQEEVDWSDYFCSDEVVTTVISGEYMPDMFPNISTKLGEILEKGFELEWSRMDDCEKCEGSRGQCGHHNKTGFICFCSDGTVSVGDCKGSKIDLRKKLAISFGSAVFGILLMCVVFYIWRRRQNKRRSYGSSYRSRNISSFTSSMTDPEKNGAYHGVQIFKYRELEKATNYFDSRNELGDGGFGTVYEGKLKDGRVVAVKRLYENNYKRVEQFMNEVGILAHLRHRNLVSLYGCTTHHSRELLLVYEYISNGTVADHLHGEKSSPGSLKWTTRMSIAVETASALVYLHASDVVHRDVKTNNILLDNSFTVKVADFGLSRLFPNNVTHVSTAPQGTPGYVDPEYHECYQLTNKSDVYSFGVVLVELISSKPAVDITRHRHEINLSSMALSKIQNDALHELVDPHLGYDTNNEIRKMINAVAELAFQCLQNDRDSRPSMDEVLECLVGVQNGMSSNKHNMLDGTSDDAVLLNHSQDMSPDSVAAAWSTSTLSTSSG